MIGMDFISFLILLIISVVVSAMLHYGFKYYVMPGFWSFCSKVVVGGIGLAGYPPSSTAMFGSSRRPQRGLPLRLGHKHCHGKYA